MNRDVLQHVSDAAIVKGMRGGVWNTIVDLLRGTGVPPGNREYDDGQGPRRRREHHAKDALSWHRCYCEVDVPKYSVLEIFNAEMDEGRPLLHVREATSAARLYAGNERHDIVAGSYGWCKMITSYDPVIVRTSEEVEFLDSLIPDGFRVALGGGSLLAFTVFEQAEGDVGTGTGSEPLLRTEPTGTGTGSGPVDYVTPDLVAVIAVPSGGHVRIRFTVLSTSFTVGYGALGCDHIVVLVTHVSCEGQGVSVGDEVDVYDPEYCHFNLPIELLVGLSGSATMMKSENYLGELGTGTGTGTGTGDPDCLAELRAAGCIFMIDYLCCAEEEYISG